jgi:hypothetical protein
MNAIETESVGSIDEIASRARKETEDFLNQWINDSTKGWPIRSDIVNGHKEHYSIQMAPCHN